MESPVNSLRCSAPSLWTIEQIADGVEFINGQAREDRNDEADLTDWSPVQRVQFVQSQKKRLADKKSKTLDQITVQQTFNHLKRLHIASRSEDYAIGFIQACGLVAKNMLSIAGVYDLLNKLMEMLMVMRKLCQLIPCINCSLFAKLAARRRTS